MIDYRDLLKKYMRHVLNWEGITFTDLMDGSSISLEEQAELKLIAREVCDQ
jgi:hypothetical protein